MPSFSFRRFALIAAFSVPTPILAEGLSGAYLAARQASISGDFKTAAHYFTRALTRDPGNPMLMDNATLANIAIGQFDRAIPIARIMIEGGFDSQIAAMTMLVHHANRGEFEAVRSRLDQGQVVSPPVDGLIRAWSHIGDGDRKIALALFDDLADAQGLGPLATYHKALALAADGNFAAAHDIFSGDDKDALRSTRRRALAHIEIMSQIGLFDDALAFLEFAFGTELDHELRSIKASLDAGKALPFHTVTNAQDGMAEVFFTIASYLLNESGQDLVLLYSRIAEFLRPAHVEATLMSAGLLERMNRYALAIETYKRVPHDHPAFHVAELGRVDSLRTLGRIDVALEALAQLAVTHGGLPVVHSTTGDLLRDQKRFEEAIAAYDLALERMEDRQNASWFIYYARGICYERLGQWDRAEPDFRRALELDPDRAAVLNYLGYSLVEKKQAKLAEALEMIQRAAELEPESGYIIDSLGWVYFRLGRYNQAVVQMERAAEIMPIDPVVNDHLGDVYWALGRYREAEFQWRRALSFVDHEAASDDADPDRIRRKIEEGLDLVLEEEGADPLQIANEDG